MTDSPPVDTLLEQLIVAAENLAMGRYGDHDRIFAMTDGGQYPPLIARLAEAFGMMAVQIEAREFRLEQMVGDLTTARDQLQQSLQELQQAQLQLIHQEKMETVGRLAAGVAHEVKNPLAIIQLGVDFLTSQLQDNRSCQETVIDMGDAVQRADRVIKGLLDFSRSEQLDRRDTDIRKVIDDSLLLVRHELNSRHVTVEFDRPETLPLLMLDSNKLKQVFINLFINAAHAMPQGGMLTIGDGMRIVTPADLVNCGSSQERPAAGEQVVVVRVADTGNGIPVEAQTKLFDPFFTTKPVGVGTGLGLSVTRNILALHQALITLTNRSDRPGAEAILLFSL